MLIRTVGGGGRDRWSKLSAPSFRDIDECLLSRAWSAAGAISFRNVNWCAVIGRISGEPPSPRPDKDCDGTRRIRVRASSSDPGWAIDGKGKDAGPCIHGPASAYYLATGRFARLRH